MASTYALNDDPFAAPDFLAGLEAAGYLQRLDTSEERITARYQHALAKMSFAAHSEEFLTRAGVKKVHRSTIQFFNETPVSDPFIHVLVGSLPPSRQALVTPRGCETSGWTPIRSQDEMPGTMHFTVSHEGFWPIVVVFDTNHSLDKEDKYATIRYDNESDEDPEAYLGQSRSRRTGLNGSQYGSGRASGAGGSGYYSSSGRAGRARSGSYAAGAGDSSSDSELSGDGTARRGTSRYGDGSGAYGGGSSRRAASRRGSMTAEAMNEGFSQMALGRSASRAGSQPAGRSASRASRRNSMAASGAGY